jgi:hypothetical protein
MRSEGPPSHGPPPDKSADFQEFPLVGARAFEPPTPTSRGLLSALRQLPMEAWLAVAYASAASTRLAQEGIGRRRQRAGRSSALDGQTGRTVAFERPRHWPRLAGNGMELNCGCSAPDVSPTGLHAACDCAFATYGLAPRLRTGSVSKPRSPPGTRNGAQPTFATVASHCQDDEACVSSCPREALISGSIWLHQKDSSHHSSHPLEKSGRRGDNPLKSLASRTRFELVLPP